MGGLSEAAEMGGEAADLGEFGDGLEGHPAAAVAGQLPAEHPQVQHLLHVGRGQHRHLHVHQRKFALCGEAGRFGGRIVTHNQQDTAVGGRSPRIRVADGVTGAVETLPVLAVLVCFGEKARYVSTAPCSRCRRLWRLFFLCIETPEEAEVLQMALLTLIAAYERMVWPCHRYCEKTNAARCRV